VFTRTKHKAKQLSGKLARAGFRAVSLQGNLSQSKRQDAMNGFKTGKYQVLVATDIAARGIDVSNVSHVINYDMPSTPEIYIHRIGRTGRAERSGEAFTLITDDDRQMVNAIHRIIGFPVERRTLPGFDYNKPLQAHLKTGGGAKTNRTAGKPPGKPVGQRRNRRDAAGIFVPKKKGGRRMTPAA